MRVADPTVVSDGVVNHIEESTSGGMTTLTLERSNSLSDLEITFSRAEAAAVLRLALN